ncbi:polysaccharide pyruvyl transferase family protein [Klebsiella quasipneumoniae]
MGKKIAIATFHAAHNYGAVLQTYALYKTLQKLGHDVYLLDYSPKNLIKSYTLFPKREFYNNFISYSKAWLSLFLDYSRRYNRYSRFNNFIDKNFKILPSSIKNIDVIVVGSDQIWNPNITDGLDGNYFGVCESVSADMVFSYAASMGVSSLKDKDELDFVKFLSNLKNIGVRELSLKEYVTTLTKREVSVNLDPTLLLNKDEWSVSTNKTSREKYLLIYEVKEHPNTSLVAQKIASRLGLKIVVLAAKTNHKISKSILTDKSPEDFLELFKNAEFIVTTSFHGTVFSIINEKNFFTLEFGNDIDLRSKYLLSQVGLEDRFVYDSSMIDQKQLHIDYHDTKNNLDSLRSHSIDYIRSSLRD